MDRLTRRITGVALLKEPYKCKYCRRPTLRLSDNGVFGPINKLAQYEETGFTPVQIRQMYDALAKVVYPHNDRFKDYVDRYAVKHKITPEQALSHELVKQTCLMYMNVE